MSTFHQSAVKTDWIWYFDEIL